MAKFKLINNNQANVGLQETALSFHDFIIPYSALIVKLNSCVWLYKYSCIVKCVPINAWGTYADVNVSYGFSLLKCLI